MKFIFFSTILTLFTISSVFSQKYTISGKISDENSGESIIGAAVYGINTDNFTISDNYGFFSLTSDKKDTVFLRISYPSYSPVSLKLTFKTDTFIAVKMSEIIQIDEVVINADNLRFANNTPGTVNIPVKQINTLPLIGAEPDLIKAFQLMPGIQSGNEGSSGLYVRGGSPDQNLILLDGVPIYYINHLGGFVSIFNTDAINSVKLIKGNFPARYGGRLSSVLDVKMKDGNLYRKKYKYSVGTVTSDFLYETPVKKGKSSFLFSARGLLWGLIYQPLSRLLLKNVSIGYNFYDLNSKFNQKINNKNRIYFSIYAGKDNLNFNIKDKITGNSEKAKYALTWGNIIASARWNKIFSDKLFSNTTLAYTQYKYKSKLKYIDKSSDDKIIVQYSSGIKDLILKYDFNVNILKNYTVNAGFQTIYHNFNPGINYIYYNENDSVLKNTSIGNNKLFSSESALYAENKIKAGKFLFFNIGIRSADYYVEKKHFISIEPRILLNFYLTKYLSIKTAYTETQQNVHLLTSSTVGLPADIWVPSTGYAQPEKARQFSVGLYKLFSEKNIEFTVESYYKQMHNLIAYKEGVNFKAAAASWENKIEINGKGDSYGIEILFQKKTGKTTGWFAYTLSETNRQFDNINNGKAYPFKYDRRHDLSIVLNRKINKNISFSVSWVFASGYPFTLPLNKYITADNTNNKIRNYELIFNWADRNSFRMRTFHHLDASIFFRKSKKNGIRQWSLNIYNIYNRKNPYFYYLSDENEQWKLYQQSLFPIIPSVNYSFIFN